MIGRNRMTGVLAGVVVALIAAIGLPAGSASAAEPPPAPTPASTAGPSLTGTPVVGHTLSCLAGSWSGNPDSYSYSWLRDGAPIAGQSTSSYVVQSVDWGHLIACKVTATNSGGEYTIGGLSSGAYRVEFDKGEENYLTQYFSGQSSMWMATPVGVTVPAVTANVNAALSAGGEISGTVTAAWSGESLEHVRVCAVDPEVGNGCAWTSSTGGYTISGLPSGSYQVEFGQARPWRREPQRYLMQYYPGKTTQEEAVLVQVTAGGVTAGIDAEMQLGGQITGRVAAAAGGAVIANVEVCARQKVERALETTVCAIADQTGEYALTGLSTGSWLLHFTPPDGHDRAEAQADNFLPQYYNGKTQESEADAVSVTAGSTVSGIDASLQAGGEIEGSVTAASDGAPLAGIMVCDETMPDNCTTTDASGGYTLSGLVTGIHRLRFSASEGGNYLTQYYNDKTSYWEGEFVNVTAGGPAVSGIDAAMQTGGQIAGVVTDAVTQQPLANVQVCVDNFLGPCTRTGSNGEYTLAALKTGSYYVEFRDYEEGNHLAQSKANIPVTVGSTSNLNVALPPGGEISGRVIAGSSGAGLANMGVCESKIGPGWELGGCVKTNGPGGWASASSNTIAVAIPTSAFTSVRPARFDAKTGELDVFFKVGDPGMFTWSLFFKNADVGFADSLGISTGQSSMAMGAGSVRRICHKGMVRHKRRCVQALVPFASGSQTVANAGLVEIKVRPDAKAMKALRTSHALHVSGTFTFQSSLGGSAVSRRVSVVVHPARNHGRRHKRRRA